MSDAAPRRDDLAYRVAATGVAAHAYKIGIERLALLLPGKREGVSRLAPIDADVLTSVSLSDVQRAKVEDYVTALIADSVGRLIWQEQFSKDRLHRVSASTLRHRRIAEVLRATAPATDRAYALVVAGLRPLHDVEARARIEEMWRRANRLLRTSPHAERHALLAEHLLAVGHLSGAEVAEFLAQMND